jgi:DNA processing protein
MTVLTDEQRLDWLRLIRSENVGPRTFRALVNQFGGAAAALEALPDLARRGGRLVLKIATRAEAEAELAAAARIGARFIALGEPDYPKALKAIDTAPLWSPSGARCPCWRGPPSPSWDPATRPRPA